MPNIGFYELGDTVRGQILTDSSGGSPADADSLPTFRIRGSTALSNNTGTAAFADTGSITDATNTIPIVIAATGHRLSSGTKVTIANVGGNTAANGDFTIIVLDVNSYSLDGSSGNGAYTSGGDWHATGLYQYSITIVSGDGYERGETYFVDGTAVIESATIQGEDVFSVV